MIQEEIDKLWEEACQLAQNGNFARGVSLVRMFHNEIDDIWNNGVEPTYEI